MSTPSTDLGKIITSATARKVIYSTYVILLVIVGAIQVAFAAVSSSQPAWLIGALAVMAYLGVPVGGLAIANTSTTTPSNGDGPAQ
jgi:hypothetical protein